MFTNFSDRPEKVNTAGAIVKLGPVEMYEREAAALYQAGKYVVASRCVYQIHYSQAQQRYYASRVFCSDSMLTRRGRFHTLTGKEVNALIGYDLLN